jgi:hypothetical protein
MATFDIYARFSAEGGRTKSKVEEQLDLLEATCRAWAERNGAEVGEIVRERDVSGAAGVGQPEISTLIRRVQAGESAGILTPRLDHFGRDTIEGSLAFKKLMQAGGRLVCVSDGIDSDCKGDETIFQARMVFAEDYLRSVNAVPGSHLPCRAPGRVPRRASALWERLSLRRRIRAQLAAEAADSGFLSEDAVEVTRAIPSNKPYPLVA